MTNVKEAVAASQFETKLLEAVMEYSMLKHPFYVAWSEGKLSQEVLGEYAKQYYAHVRAFPTYVSAVHSRCDDLQIRQQLLENLIEEERGDENHPELWMRFAEGLGVSRDDVRNAKLLTSTEDSVKRMKALTASEDYRHGLAALYAYESQIPEVARTKRAGLKDFYGIENERAVSFFRVHEGIDVVHQQTEKQILTEQCKTKAEQSEALTVAKESARALCSFLDGVNAAYVTA